MKLKKYNSKIKHLSWLYGMVIFGFLIPGVFGALFLADRLSDSSSWEREYVFLCMLPMMLAPIVIGCMLAELLDKRIGLKCSCGQTLSFGKHVKELMKQGGQCPRCGKIVVENVSE